MTEKPSLIERQTDLAKMREVLDEVASGRGRVVVLDAPSGAGKTALLNEARARVVNADMQVLYATGSELEVEYPFGVALDLIEGWLVNASDAQREQLMAGQARLAKPLLAVGSPQRITGGDEFTIIHGLYWCIVNLCEVGPVAVFVDDAHLADDATLRFLNYLSARVDDLAVALFVAVRSGDIRANTPLVNHLSRRENCTPIRPAALTQQAVGTLLRREEPGLTLSPDAVRRCWMITGGNPFLVTELSTAIRTEGRAWLDANIDRLESFAPLSVRNRVLFRVSRLSEDALELARAYAVLRGSAPLELAAKIAGIDLANAVRLLDRLDQAHILINDSKPHFRHSMIRSAIYDDIPASQLAAAHTRAAALLLSIGERVEAIANHLLIGLPTSEPWALDVLMEAATAAAQKGSHDWAIRYLRHAITLAPSDSHRVPALVDLGLLEAAQGETDSGVAHLEQALDLMKDPVEKARGLYSLGSTLYRYGRHSDAAAAFERGAQLATSLDPELALEAEGAWIFASYYLDQVVPRAMIRLEELMAEIRQRGLRSPAERVILAIAGLRAVMSSSPAAKGAGLATEAVRDGLLLQTQTSASVAVNLAVLALTFSDRLDEASEVIDQVISDARHRQHAPITAEASFIRSLVDFTRGDITNAWINSQAAVDGIGRGWFGLAPMAQGTLVQCLIERDELDQAEEALSAAEQIPLTPDSRGLASWLYMARGRLQNARSDYAGAVEGHLMVGRVLSVFEAVNPAVAHWRSCAGLAAKMLGDMALAQELIDEELVLAIQFELPRQVAIALRPKSALVGRTERIALLEESLEILKTHGTPLDSSETLLEYGRALRQSGSRIEARNPLTRAMELAHRQGAFATARRAHEELLASGAKPRRSYSTGLQALTPTELRIAELAAQGLSNREVAESLFVARSTVAWHLRHIFHKLGVTTRADLPTAIESARLGH
ncbi:ATP-binding protein [Nocardia miyunensis]|uniref:ATP-binding protein n=1 Tax=Nocardia miyunensis TaxID=282684 RepID=UPI000A70AFC3|nr:LuxR family transcriptional regulator [Nocardia miyunensis]